MKEFKGPDPKVKDRGPKKTGRKVDRKATTRTVLKHRSCFCGGAGEGCDGVAATGHHVLSRSQGGDDVEANIVGASGSGTTGCHGLIEAENITARRLLGEHLVLERPDVIFYVKDKLGEGPGDGLAIEEALHPMKGQGAQLLVYCHGELRRALYIGNGWAVCLCGCGARFRSIEPAGFERPAAGVRCSS